MLSFRKTRRVLKSPDRPLAIRDGYIAEQKSLLIVIPQENAPTIAAAKYDIVDEDDILYFTAASRTSSDRKSREFRDASGLPLFEVHKASFRSNDWTVTLPGCDTSKLGSARWSFYSGASAGYDSVGDFKFTFENNAAAAVDNKKEEDRTVTLTVEKFGKALTTFDVVDGDRKIAQVKESIPHNETLALLPKDRKRSRPVLDVIVMPGVDLSLVREKLVLCCVAVGLT